MVDAGVKKDIVQQMLLQQGLLELLRQSSEASPVVRHRAAAVWNKEAQRREVLEQIAGQALHEGRRVGVQVMGASGVKAGVATGTHMDHGGDVVLHHLFVERVPVPVAQRRRSPVPTRWVRVQVDADIAKFPDAFFQLGNACARIDTG